MSSVLVMWISRGCAVAAEELLLSVCNHHSLVLVNPQGLVPAVGSACLCVTSFMSPVGWSPHPSITREMCGVCLAQGFGALVLQHLTGPWEKGRVWGFKDGNPSSLFYKTHLLQSSDVPWGCSCGEQFVPEPVGCVIQLCYPDVPSTVLLLSPVPAWPRPPCPLQAPVGARLSGHTRLLLPFPSGSPARLRGRGFRGAKPRWQERPPLLLCR